MKHFALARTRAVHSVHTIVAVLVAVAFTLVLTPVTARALTATDVVADAPTHNAWRTYEDETSTRDVGVVHVDKSVVADDAMTFADLYTNAAASVRRPSGATFLTDLSALSTTLFSRVAAETPLDVVLVLDVSGSMDETIYNYELAYPTGTAGEYYVRIGGSDVAVTYTYRSSISSGRVYGWYDAAGTAYAPRTSAADANATHVQFYTRTSSGTTRMGAMQEAADSFLSTIAAANEGRSAATQHRVAVVKFAGYYYGTNSHDAGAVATSYRVSNDKYYSNQRNYTQIVQDFTECAGSGAASLTAVVDGLTAGGATSAEKGMALAQAVFEGGRGTLVGARSDAKRVIVFLTDGQPTHGSDYQGSVAAKAVSTAKAMKDAGATIFSVGVVEGADPADTTSDFNRYMNAVSSNYPVATGTVTSESANTGIVELGDPAGDGMAYYVASSSADELQAFFKNVADTIASADSVNPLDMADAADGGVTFTDELGAYQGVVGVEAIVYPGADGTYTAYTDPIATTETDAETGDTITTYTFAAAVAAQVGSGEANADELRAAGANLADVRISVRRSTTLEAGDVVSVYVPPRLVPQHEYTVTSASDGAITLTRSHALPIHVVYSSGAKAGLAELLDTLADVMLDPTSEQTDALTALVSYADTHAAGAGVTLYANRYDTEVNASRGSTTATLRTPRRNPHHYVAANAQLYRSVGAAAEATFEPVSAPADSDELAAYVAAHLGEWYLQQVSYRLSTTTGDAAERVVEYVRYVDDDVTDATRDAAVASVAVGADDVLYVTAGTPRWAGAGVGTAKAEGANASGTAPLECADELNADAALVTSYLGNNARMSVPVSGAASVAKVARAAVSDLRVPDATFTYSFSLAGVSVQGLASATASYPAAVFDADGTRVRTLSVAPGGTFELAAGERIVIAGLPAGTRAIFEERETGGFTASVVADADGAVISPNGRGVVLGVVLASTTGATFTNIYEASLPTGDAPVVRVSKTLAGRALAAGEARFALVSARDGVVLRPDEGTVDDGSGAPLTLAAALADDSLRALLDGASYANPQGAAEGVATTFTLPAATLGADTLTSVRLEELAAAGLLAKESSDAGSVTYTLEARVAELTDVLPKAVAAEGAATRAVTLTYVDDGTGTLDASVAYPDDPEASAAAFTNTYRPDDVSTTMGLSLGKRLTGRAWLDDDAFTFTLAAVGGTAPAAAPAAATPMPVDSEGNARHGGTSTQRIAAGVPGVAYDGELATASGPTWLFTYDDLAEYDTDGTPTGHHVASRTFAYTLTEDAPAASNGVWRGVTYDARTVSLTITLADEAGTLTASARLGSTTSLAATFTNTYASTASYATDAGGFTLRTRLSGRPAIAGSMGFAITPQATDDRAATGDEPAVAGSTAAEAAAKLGIAEDGRIMLANPAAADGELAVVDAGTTGGLSRLTFTQADFARTGIAGTTYVDRRAWSYTVAELVPEGATRTVADDGSVTYTAGGYTYDAAPRTVSVVATDNHDGSIALVTTVTTAVEHEMAGVVSYTYDTETFTSGATTSFEHTYAPAPLTWLPEGLTKRMDGDDLVAGAYTFVLGITGLDDVTAHGTNVAARRDATGSASAAIAFDADDAVTLTLAQLAELADAGVATHTTDGDTLAYTLRGTVTEDTTDLPAGVSSVVSSVPLELTVTDAGTGTLTADVRYPSGSELVNRTAAGDVTLAVRGDVTLTGVAIADGQFAFELTALDGAPLRGAGDGDSDSDTLRATNVGTSVSFATLTFTEDDLAADAADATYTYRVREVIPEGATAIDAGTYTYRGITYTGATSDFTVTLHKDVATNRLSVATEPTGSVCSFDYAYTASTWSALGDQVAVGKVLAGRAITAADDFTVMLLDATGAVVVSGPEGARHEVVATVSAEPGESTGTFALPGVYFTQDDAGSTYTYQLVEAAGTRGGVTYDRRAHTVRAAVANVVDSDGIATGELSVAWTVDGVAAGDGVTFANSYDAAGTVSVAATSTIAGRDALAGEVSVALYAPDAWDADAGAPVAGATPLVVGTSAAANDGEAARVALGNVSFAEGVRTGSVSLNSLVDAGVASRYVDDDGHVAYTLTLYATQSTTSPNLVRTNPAYAVRVTLTDDENGNLTGEATVLRADTGEPVDALSATYDFVPNVVSSRPTDAAGIAVNTTLIGRGLERGEFVVGLYTSDAWDDAAGAPVAGAEPHATGANVAAAESGVPAQVSVGAVSFERAGTYRYRLAERAGNAGGVTYDTTSYVVVARVTTVVGHNGVPTGALSVAWALEGVAGNTATFVNHYGVAAVESAPTGSAAGVAVSAVVVGRGIDRGELAFALYAAASWDDAAGAPVAGAEPHATGENVAMAEDGVPAQVSLGAVRFTAPGTYRYRLVETGGTLAGATYDDAVFELIATVVDNGDGTLAVSWATTADAVTFVNRVG